MGSGSSGISGSSFSAVRLRITDPGDNNPFNGSGVTKIDVFTTNPSVPFFSFTRTGGYSENYVNFLSSGVGGFDNLQIAVIPEPMSASLLVGVAGLYLTGRRRRQTSH